MRIERRYTKAGQSPYADVEFRLTASEIKNPDGSVVFRASDIEVPAAWSQVACDILAQKYFRRAGVPAFLKRTEENSVPSWLWRSVADDERCAELPEKQRRGGETSAKQVFNRLAGTWTYWGWKGGYFDSEDDAHALYDELSLHARHPEMRSEFAAVVQHRAALGLRHRRPRPGSLLRRPRDRPAREVAHRLRASAAPCLLHPVDHRRPGQ